MGNLCKEAGIAKSTFYQHHRFLNEIIDERDFVIFFEIAAIIDKFNAKYGIPKTENWTDKDRQEYINSINWGSELEPRVVNGFGVEELKILLQRILMKLRHYRTELNMATNQLDYRLFIMMVYYLRKTIVLYWQNNLPKRNFETTSRAYRHLAFEIIFQIDMAMRAEAVKNDDEAREIRRSAPRLIMAINQNLDRWI